MTWLDQATAMQPKPAPNHGLANAVSRGRDPRLAAAEKLEGSKHCVALVLVWGEGFIQDDLQPVQEVDIGLIGAETRVEPDDCASVE